MKLLAERPRPPIAADPNAKSVAVEYDGGHRRNKWRMKGRRTSICRLKRMFCIAAVSILFDQALSAREDCFLGPAEPIYRRCSQLIPCFKLRSTCEKEAVTLFLSDFDLAKAQFVFDSRPGFQPNLNVWFKKRSAQEVKEFIARWITHPAVLKGNGKSVSGYVGGEIGHSEKGVGIVIIFLSLSEGKEAERLVKEAIQRQESN